MPLITINYSIGTDGKDIAQTVAQKLGVELFDDKALQTFATKTKMSTSNENSFELRTPGFWQRLRSREPQIYLDIMEAAVYDIAKEGEGVIIGHGSQMLLRDFSCAFHVRLLSTLNLRVDNLISSQDISRTQAADLIVKYDKSQKAFFRYAFQIDFDKPALYDLVINMNKMKKKTIVNLVIEALESEDIQTCSFDALSSMEKLALERKIHAELPKKNIDISTLKIAVPKNGEAEITGAAVSQEEKDRIVEIVNDVQGISHVRADLSVWIYPL
jgi:cytidylate kinase